MTRDLPALLLLAEMPAKPRGYQDDARCVGPRLATIKHVQRIDPRDPNTGLYRTSCAVSAR